MLVFMCSDPGDAMCKVSCGVEPSFKNSDFDASIRPALYCPKNETMVNLKSASFVVIMLLHKGLTRMHSQTKPRLLFGESFTSKRKSLTARKK